LLFLITGMVKLIDYKITIYVHHNLKIRCRVSGVRREERKSGNPKPYIKLHIVGTANRSLRRAQPCRISNIEPQNVEGWNRFAQSFLK
jgi:hypothetical protein